MGSSLSLSLFPALENLLLLQVTFSGLVVMAFALSYCISFCHVWLLSLGDLFFFFFEGGWGEVCFMSQLFTGRDNHFQFLGKVTNK